jgi:hypothetical protein
LVGPIPKNTKRSERQTVQRDSGLAVKFVVRTGFIPSCRQAGREVLDSKDSSYQSLNNLQFRHTCGQA